MILRLPNATSKSLAFVYETKEIQNVRNPFHIQNRMLNEFLYGSRLFECLRLLEDSSQLTLIASPNPRTGIRANTRLTV